LSPKTQVVNLLAGPGAGKSTSAAMVFSKLKKRGVLTELIQEYAKDKTWQEDWKTLRFQPKVTMEQAWRQYRVMDKVDVIITDTALILGLLYSGWGCTPAFSKYVLELYNEFNNTNILLKRDPSVHPYQKVGRTQTEEEAFEIDRRLAKLLEENNIPYYEITVKADDSHIEEILSLIPAYGPLTEDNPPQAAPFQRQWLGGFPSYYLPRASARRRCGPRWGCTDC
jgi:nicotinamide riboside kinase